MVAMMSETIAVSAAESMKAIALAIISGVGCLRKRVTWESNLEPAVILAMYVLFLLCVSQQVVCSLLIRMNLADQAWYTSIKSLGPRYSVRDTRGPEARSRVYK